jgi:hypothetical protein
MSFELGLTHEQDLQQLRGRRLEVRQQPHLLEHLRREVLRLVDDQERDLVAAQAVDQEVVQRHQVLGLGPARVLDVELVEQHPQEVERLDARIEDERRGHRRLELRQQRVDQRRLPRADFAVSATKPFRASSA